MDFLDTDKKGLIKLGEILNHKTYLPKLLAIKSVLQNLSLSSHKDYQKMALRNSFASYK